MSKKMRKDFYVVGRSDLLVLTAELVQFRFLLKKLGRHDWQEAERLMVWGEKRFRYC